MKYINLRKPVVLCLVLIFGVLSISQTSYAQTGNKVVVIPLGSDGPKLTGGFDDDGDSTSHTNSSITQVGHWLGLNFRIIPEPGGAGANDGRLEVSINGGAFGTVCDDDFDDNDNAARVVCRSLGYSDGVLRDAQFITDGAGATLIDNMTCPNNARTFLDCGVRVLGEENCTHSEDVGVTCIE